MFQLLKKYQKSNVNTKWFVWTALIYTLAIIATTLYCYARLTFVSSGQQTKTTQTQ